MSFAINFVDRIKIYKIIRVIMLLRGKRCLDLELNRKVRTREMQKFLPFFFFFPFSF